MASPRLPRPASVSRRRFLGTAGTGLLGASVMARGATPVAEREVDVLVCGGGCAGLGAALSAARNGAKTLLLERAGFAGGIITTVGLPFFDGMADIADKKIVVRGIAMELLSKSGVCEPAATHLNTHNPTVHNVEKFKLLSDRLLLAERPRLEVLYHTTVCGVEMEGDRIGAVMIANKGGITRVRAKVIVDSTGDADVANFAGAETVKAPELQPMSLHFRIGHVKGSPNMRDNCQKALERAHERGELPMFYGPGVMFMFASDEVYIHGIRVPGDATDPAAFTQAEMQGRSDAWAMFEAWKKEVPGFEDAYFMTSGPFIGVRETRRLVGQHVLTEQEVMSTTSFEDAIATGCWYLDLHPNKITTGGANAVPKQQPKPYDIPYRSLLPKGVSNLLVAGRCHSATQLAASSTRVTVTAMAMGEAAGTAAALAVKSAKSPQEIAAGALRTALREKGGGPIHDWV